MKTYYIIYQKCIWSLFFPNYSHCLKKHSDLYGLPNWIFYSSKLFIVAKLSFFKLFYCCSSTVVCIYPLPLPTYPSHPYQIILKYWLYYNTTELLLFWMFLIATLYSSTVSSHSLMLHLRTHHAVFPKSNTLPTTECGHLLFSSGWDLAISSECRASSMIFFLTFLALFINLQPSRLMSLYHWNVWTLIVIYLICMYLVYVLNSSVHFTCTENGKKLYVTYNVTRKCIQWVCQKIPARYI